MDTANNSPHLGKLRRGLAAAWPLAVYLTLIAVTLAYLEVQIEGPDGWATALPTWRVEDPRLTWIFGGRPVTGYHVGLNLLLVLFFHWPVLFTRWSLVQEVRVLSSFLVLAVVWDFLWFVLNPHFGLARYSPDEVWWFKRWWLGFPADYFLGLTNALIIRCVPALLRRETWRDALTEAAAVVLLTLCLVAGVTFVVQMLRG